MAVSDFGALKRILLALMLSLAIFDAQALDTTEVLPQGISSPSFRWADISRLNERFTERGMVESLGDRYTFDFDAPTLAKFEPRVQELINVLNQFGRNRIGDQLDLGILRIEASPHVRYFAPVFAHGVTSKWTLALGLPVVSYENKVTVSQFGSNLALFRANLGGFAAEIDDAFSELDGSLVSGIQNELRKKGYKPLQDRSETFLGDLQLVSLYRFLDSGKWSALARTAVTLPTGPKDDPDDLADLSVFSATAVEQQAIVALQPVHRLIIAAKMGFRWNVPDEIDVRVPTSAEDMLPGPETKENVTRDTGDIWVAGLSGKWALHGRVGVGGGYEYAHKSADRYNGGRGTDYSLLSGQASSDWHKLRVGAEYTAVEAYKKDEALLPFTISYEYSDLFAGTNTERQEIHELWLTLFF